MNKKRIYISGRITGLDINVATSYFKSAEIALEGLGFIPLNPMEIMPYHPDHTWVDYMIEDIKAIFYSDGLLMLENWGQSKGARIEHAIAIQHGLPIYYSLDELNQVI